MRWPLVGIGFALAAGIGGALAAPLDEQACKGLKTEREALVTRGIESDMAKGPEWAKSNLQPDRLKEVARLIELNEQLTFRCGQLTVARPDGKPLLKKEDPAPKGAATEKKGANPAAPAAAGAPPAKKKKKAAAEKPADANVPPPKSGPAPPAMAP
jgi:hypothetical protein